MANRFATASPCPPALPTTSSRFGDHFRTPPSASPPLQAHSWRPDCCALASQAACCHPAPLLHHCPAVEGGPRIALPNEMVMPWKRSRAVGGPAMAQAGWLAGWTFGPPPIPRLSAPGQPRTKSRLGMLCRCDLSRDKTSPATPGGWLGAVSTSSPPPRGPHTPSFKEREGQGSEWRSVNRRRQLRRQQQIQGDMPAPGMHWKGGRYPPPFSRTPSLCPATVPLTPSASFNGICNRQ